MKIYTKTGDKGKTSLIGGTKVPKSHIRIEAYGTVDELNSWIGLVGDQIKIKKEKEILQEIQDRLFTIGSSLACDPEKEPKLKIPDLVELDIIFLEKEIDKLKIGVAYVFTDMKDNKSNDQEIDLIGSYQFTKNLKLDLLHAIIDGSEDYSRAKADSETRIKVSYSF